jgi:hypothetical protein
MRYLFLLFFAYLIYRFLIKPFFIVKTYSSFNRNPEFDMSEFMRRVQEIQKEKYRNDVLDNLENKKGQKNKPDSDYIDYEEVE